MKGKLDMGRRLLKLVGSRPGFFRMGVTKAVLSEGGTEPELREEWIISVMRGASEEQQDLTRVEGSGSSWHV